MPKGYRPYLPDQDLLLPPSLRDWRPEDHLVYFVSDVVDQLDLSAMHDWYGEEKRGQPPYDPVLMTKLLVYGYCTGVFSSRRLQKRIQEDIPFKVLAAGNEPDFRTISDFRKIHLVALEGLFEQVLELALESGSVKLGRVSLDGTKITANASKHKAMSYGRAEERQQQLRQEVRELLAQAAAADEEEDRRHGNRRGDELPEELRRRETRLAKIKHGRTPRTIPSTRPKKAGCAFRLVRRMENRIAPPATPRTNKPAIAIACSTVFAVSDVGPRCSARMTSTIITMPKPRTFLGVLALASRRNRTAQMADPLSSTPQREFRRARRSPSRSRTDRPVHRVATLSISCSSLPLARAVRPSHGSCLHFGEQDGL
jgi:transposase